MTIECSSFLACMRTNKTAHDEAGVGDHGTGNRSQAKDGKSIRKRSIIGVTTFVIVFAITCSLIVPGGLLNHQIALAENGATDNSAMYNASNSYVPQLAPLNPAYVAYVNSKSGLKAMSFSASGSVLVLIPAPLDLSGLTGEQIDTSGSFPVYGYSGSYDLRTLNKVTPIKDQNPSGSCWAFATYGSMESYLLPGETWDFSENNLKNNAGFDIGPNDGGNYEMAMAYLTRWSGPVNESDDPFNSSPSATSPTNLNVQKHVQNAYVIPDRSSYSDNNNIKWALTNYGAVFTSMYWDVSYYNSADYAYYNSVNESKIGNNHAVTIVGWDDNYKANNFLPAAPGNGAFIVKNSWGSSWGDSGYFYVSYYDENFGLDNVAFTADPTTNYNHIYQYDPLGWVGSFSCDGSNTAWFANDFTAGSKENITAVGFYTISLNSQYTVDILENGNVVGITTGTLPMAGYNTVVLNAPVTASAGSKFRVAVHLTTPGNNYPIPLEYPRPGYSSKAYSNASESFIGSTLNNMVDIRNYYTNASVCLKAYTVDYTTGPGTLQYSQSAYSVYENKGSAPITVNRVGGTMGTVTVKYATNGGSATPGTDYTPVSGTLTFNDGETSKSFSVPVMDDGIYGSNEIVFLNLSSPTGGASLGLSAASLTIAEADGIPTVQFNASTYKVNENSGVVYANVTLNGIASSDITVNYATASGTATSGSDFMATTGVLTFKPGDYSKLIPISIINDSIYEPDQNFTITLSSPSSNVIIGSPATATITIKDDDTAPSIQFQSQSYNVSEGGSLATINVVLSAPSEVPIGVSYSTADGTALAGMNYTQTSGVLQFAGGATVASFNVPIIDNYVINKNTTFNVSLSNPTGGASLDSPTKAAVNIIEDDRIATVILNLSKGWNLISIPVALADNNISDFFTPDEKANVTIVWSYDNSNPSVPVWKYYKPTRANNTLANIEVKTGYWFSVKNDMSIQVTGVLPGNKSITINDGWNLIGDPDLSTHSPSELFGNYYLTWGYTDNLWYFYKPSRTSNTLASIEPCMGYWVKKQ